MSDRLVTAPRGSFAGTAVCACLCYRCPPLAVTYATAMKEWDAAMIVFWEAPPAS